MFKINFSTVYNRKNKLNKRGEATIHIRANQKGKTVYFNTDITIKPSLWNNTKREIRNAHPQHITLNREIARLKDELIDLEAKIFKRKKAVTLGLLRDFYENTAKYNDSFIEFYESELFATATNTNTFYTEKSTLLHLKSFRKDLAFSELDFEFLTDFVNHFEKKGYHKNTINKYTRHIKKYLNIAINKDLIEVGQNPFFKFNYPTVPSRRKFLKSNEVIKITQFLLPKEHEKLQKYLDAFLLSFYTGLRISDLTSLKKTDIKHSLKNGNYIEKEMIKTKSYVYVPLDNIFNVLKLDVPKFNLPMEIIKRNSEKSKSDLIFTNISHGKYPKLKEVFELAKINYVSYHGARHAIAMFLINDIGLDINSIGQILGHKNIKTTAIYSRMSNEGLNNRLRIVHSNQQKHDESQSKAM